MKKNRTNKKAILKKGVIKIALYIMYFNFNLMLYNYNTYDLIIDLLLLLINITILFVICRSMLYYDFKLYVYKNKINLL